MVVKLIRCSKIQDFRGKLELILLALAGIFDGMIVVASLGYLTSDVRPWLLYGAPNWLMRDDEFYIHT